MTLIARGVKNGVKNTIGGVAQALENPEASGELVFNTSTTFLGGPAGGVGKVGTAFQGSGRVVMSLKGAGGKSLGAIADVVDAASDFVSGKLKVKKSKAPSVGGGASLDNLTEAEILRIQNAAIRTKQDITVVGSRSRGNARADSDWDYVMSGNSRKRHSASSSVPRGEAGGSIDSRGVETGIDVFYGAVNPELPFITFHP